jgi:hypothetical protein
MHELEGPRRSCAPCQAAITRHRPAAPDRSTSRWPRLLVAGLSRNGCPEVPGSRSLGSRSSVDVSAAVSPGRLLGRASFVGLPRVVSRSRSLGSRSCAERGCSSWSSGADRSAPAPVWSGCPADSAPITRGPPARDCPASSHLDCSGHSVAGRALLVDRRLLARPRLGTHHRSREPVSDRGLPRPATFRKSPSGPAPVPGDIASCSGPGDSPTRAFGPRFRRVLASTGRSTGQPGVVPRSRPVVHRFIHRTVHIT